MKFWFLLIIFMNVILAFATFPDDWATWLTNYKDASSAYASAALGWTVAYFGMDI